MKTRILFFIGVVILSQSCDKGQRVTLDRALDIAISLENKQLTEGMPNFLTLKMENTSDRTVKVPNSDLVIEFTSFSGSIKRVIPLRDIVNGTSDMERITGLKLKPREEKDIRIELGNLIYGKLQKTDNKLPADDYTINVFLTADKDLQDLRYADNIRSNYIDIYIYD